MTNCSGIEFITQGVSVKGAAKTLGLNAKFVHDLVRDGKISSFRYPGGGKILVSLVEIESAIAAMIVPARETKVAG